MEVCLKVKQKMDYIMVMEEWHMLTEIFIKGSGKMEKQTAMAYLLTQMEACMLETG